MSKKKIYNKHLEKVTGDSIKMVDTVVGEKEKN